jgi:hypothetical protein
LKIKINTKARISSWLCLILHLPQASRWRRDTKNYGSLRSIGLLCCLWGIFKNRHLSNATGRIRDESLINQGGRGENELRTPEEQLWHSHHTVHIRQAYQNILKR